MSAFTDEGLKSFINVIINFRGMNPNMTLREFILRTMADEEIFQEPLSSPKPQIQPPPEAIASLTSSLESPTFHPHRREVPRGRSCLMA